jgi:hypothetical protein
LTPTLGLIPLVHAQAGEVTLKPTDDTYVDRSNPNLNYGADSILEIQNYQSVPDQNYQCDIWLKFNLSSVPDGAVIDTATLQLHTYIVEQKFSVAAYSSSNDSWTESTLTYSNRPTYNMTPMDSVLVVISSQWYNWSTVDAVMDSLSKGLKVATIVMHGLQTFSPQTVQFESKESPYLDYSPALIVHWSNVVPEFPVFLALPFFMLATLLPLIVDRRKRTK